jgi:hypothetical protein
MGCAMNYLHTEAMLKACKTSDPSEHLLSFYDRIGIRNFAPSSSEYCETCSFRSWRTFGMRAVLKLLAVDVRFRVTMDSTVKMLKLLVSIAQQVT